MSDAYERKLTSIYDALDAHNWKVCQYTIESERHDTLHGQHDLHTAGGSLW